MGKKLLYDKQIKKNTYNYMLNNYMLGLTVFQSSVLSRQWVKMCNVANISYSRRKSHISVAIVDVQRMDELASRVTGEEMEGTFFCIIFMYVCVNLMGTSSPQREAPGFSQSS